MFRLGIIGSDNSHAEQFARLANLDEGINGMRIEDTQVTHIYGTDPARTKEVAELTKIPNIVEHSEEMLGAVDGVLCVWRHGSKHLHDTAPFIKAGLPAFVDKPLASSVADAQELVSLAQQAKVGFSSFSTLRYCQSTVDFLSTLGEAVGDPTAGVSTGWVELDSEYDRIYFYAIHAVELMHATWGYGVESVVAKRSHNNCMAVCNYANGPLVTLNLLGEPSAYVFHLSAFGTKGFKDHKIDAGTTYYDGMKVIMEMMRSGNWPLTPEQLIEPIKVIAAIDRSMAEGRSVSLGEV